MPASRSSLIGRSEQTAVRTDGSHFPVEMLAIRAGEGDQTRLACILRDQVQTVLAEVVGGTPEPLYTLPETELTNRVASARGATASTALARVYKRLRALPSRGQAAAPWSTGHIPRREFDALYRDVADLCRTLGSPLPES